MIILSKMLFVELYVVLCENPLWETLLDDQVIEIKTRSMWVELGHISLYREWICKCKAICFVGNWFWTNHPKLGSAWLSRLLNLKVNDLYWSYCSKVEKYTWSCKLSLLWQLLFLHFFLLSHLHSVTLAHPAIT